MKNEQRKAAYEWSSDGDFLLMDVRTSKGDIWVLPMDAGPGVERKALPYAVTGNNTGARLSPQRD